MCERVLSPRLKQQSVVDVGVAVHRPAASLVLSFLWQSIRTTPIRIQELANWKRGEFGHMTSCFPLSSFVISFLKAFPTQNDKIKSQTDRVIALNPNHNWLTVWSVSVAGKTVFLAVVPAVLHFMVVVVQGGQAVWLHARVADLQTRVVRSDCQVLGEDREEGITSCSGQRVTIWQGPGAAIC